jgi:outer membrane protein assembly factor BamE (lipoprotein component of BamABCDE complex)
MSLINFLWTEGVVMNVSQRFSILVLGLFLLGGCSSTGNKQIADTGTVSKIEVGKSTKNDVRALVGEPTKVDFRENNTERWEYTYTRGQMRPATLIAVVGWFAGGMDTTGNTLTIVFNKDNIVQKVGSGKISGGGSLSD